MEALRSSRAAGGVEISLGSTSRTVPVAAAELRSLLLDQSTDGPLAELFVVQRSLSVGGVGLHSISPVVLKAALTQMDLVGCRTPGLGILRLKMARQIATNEAREQADRLPGEMKWRPLAAGHSARGEGHSTLRFDSGFPDTVSTATPPEGDL